MKIISLEGIDGSGKSTLYNLLKKECLSNKVLFAKSPIEPFSSLVPEFWNLSELQRFAFFYTANIHFINSISKEDYSVIVLDRFIYSTLITHNKFLGIETLSPYAKAFSDLINKYSITLETFFIKPDLGEALSRLEERNNPIDNELKADQKVFENLYNEFYSTQYSSQLLSGGTRKTLINNTSKELAANLETIKLAVASS